jgi:hypothetical protein
VREKDEGTYKSDPKVQRLANTILLQLDEVPKRQELLVTLMNAKRDLSLAKRNAVSHVTVFEGEAKAMLSNESFQFAGRLPLPLLPNAIDLVSQSLKSDGSRIFHEYPPPKFAVEEFTEDEKRQFKGDSLGGKRKADEEATEQQAAVRPRTE